VLSIEQKIDVVFDKGYGYISNTKARLKLRDLHIEQVLISHLKR